MSEKRFIISKNTGERFPTGIIDVERQTHLWVVEVVDLLNEQQATIQELERKLKKYAKIGEEQLKQIIELQDLCGESDSENAKLRIKNNEQQEQLDLYKEAILTMLGLLADKGIIFSGVKDE